MGQIWKGFKSCGGEGVMDLESLYRESSDIDGPEKSSHVIAWSHFESIADRIGRISVCVLTFLLYAAFSFVFYFDFTK